MATPDELIAFDTEHVGSSKGSLWIVVQKARHRFQTSQEGGLRIRFVIRNYLACEVAWD